MSERAFSVRVVPPARVVALVALVASVFLAGVPRSASAQGSNDFELEEYTLVPTLFSIDVGLSGVYDSNIDHDEEEFATYGLKADARVRLRSSARRPLLRLDYKIDIRRYKDTQKWDRQSHYFSAFMEKRFGPLSLDTKGSASLNASNEDREVGDRYSVFPRLSLRMGPTRLRLYGAYETRQYTETVEKSETVRGAGAEFGGRGRAGSQLTVGYRYEEGESPTPERRFLRQRYTAAYRVNVGARGLLRLEVEHRRRRFPQKPFVPPEGEDAAVETRDFRWEPSALFRYRFPRGYEFRLEYEFQRRISNDPSRQFNAHRGTLSVRIPIISPVRKQARQ